MNRVSDLKTYDSSSTSTEALLCNIACLVFVAKQLTQAPCRPRHRPSAGPARRAPPSSTGASLSASATSGGARINIRSCLRDLARTLRNERLCGAQKQVCAYVHNNDIRQMELGSQNARMVKHSTMYN